MPVVPEGMAQSEPTSAPSNIQSTSSLAGPSSVVRMPTSASSAHAIEVIGCSGRLYTMRSASYATLAGIGLRAAISLRRADRRLMLESYSEASASWRPPNE